MGTRIAATTGFATALPGGIHNERGPDTPSDYPYGVFRVRPAAPAVLAGFEGHYLQDFDIDLVAFTPVGVSGDPSQQTVQQFLLRALVSDEANTAFAAASLRNSGEQYMTIRPVEPAGEFAQELAGARDVFVAGVTGRLTVLGVRSAA